MPAGIHILLQTLLCCIGKKLAEFFLKLAEFFWLHQIKRQRFTILLVKIREWKTVENNLSEKRQTINFRNEYELLNA